MTGETMRSRTPAGRAGFFNNLLAFVNALVAFIESRLALFANESKAAFGQLLGVLACLVGALLFFAIGYTFLVVTVIAGIARLMQVPWIWVTLTAAFIHFALVLALLLGTRALVRRPPFRKLTAELKKDREWLRNLDETSRPAR